MFSKRRAALLMPALLAAAMAWAAPPVPPLTVDADRSTATSYTNSDIARINYDGHVVITRGEVVIHGAHAVVYTRHQHLEKAVVTGAPSRFSWRPANAPPVHGQALKITYVAAGDTVELEGQATLHRGGETFSAAHVRYNLATRVLHAHSAKGERVHVVIPPATSADGPATTPP